MSLFSRLSAFGAAMMIAGTVHAAPTLAQAHNDVAGISVGDSVASAKQKMLKANPNLKFIEVPMYSGIPSILGQEIIPNKYRNQAFEQFIKDEFLIIQTHDHTVGSVSRFQRLGEGKKFSKQQLLTALTEKYGENNDIAKNNDFSKYVWAYNNAGKFLPEADYTCAKSGFDSQMRTMTIKNKAYFSVARYIADYGKECQVVVQADMTLDKEGLVSTYTVSLGDVKRMLDDNIAAEQAKKDAEAAKRAEAVKAAEKNGSPKL